MIMKSSSTVKVDLFVCLRGLSVALEPMHVYYAVADVFLLKIVLTNHSHSSYINTTWRPILIMYSTSIWCCDGAISG